MTKLEVYKNFAEKFRGQNITVSLDNGREFVNAKISGYGRYGECFVIEAKHVDGPNYLSLSEIVSVIVIPNIKFNIVFGLTKKAFGAIAKDLSPDMLFYADPETSICNFNAYINKMRKYEKSI